MKTLIAFENEEIVSDIGSDTAKIQFLQDHPRVAHFHARNKSVSFSESGIYQLTDGPPLFILPWFLRASDRSIINIDSSLNDLFSSIQQIKVFLESKVDLEKYSDDITAIDLIGFSFLQNLLAIIKQLSSVNYHEEITEEISSIKGKWNIQKDISKNPMPLRFTCTYGTLENDTAFFRFIKSFLRRFRDGLKSKKNLMLIDEILTYLPDVMNVSPTRTLLLEAKFWIRSHKMQKEIMNLLDFCECILFDDKVYSEKSGVCYKFEMDKFFECLVAKMFSQTGEYSILTQTRDDLLGGAVWRVSGQISNDDGKKATQVTIPDVIAFNESNYLVLECKYKPMKINFINNNDTSEWLKSFSRDDRNQLLSFLMSLRPSPAIKGKKIVFSIVFPCSSIETFKISELCFESAKINIDPIVRSLVQNRIKVSEGSALVFKFIGINVSYALKQLTAKKVEFVKQLIDELVSNERNIELRPETNFQKTLQKRIGLASLIVSSTDQDNSMGRTKLAKIFYLADAHLNLGMQANYLREAAGPLDPSLLYNEKWGIEKVASRESIFQQVERNNRHNKWNRYLKGNNFSNAVANAERVFADKIENIRNLLFLLQSLDTTRSEIVATLYACWNDLIARKKNVNDFDIIEDFRNNWHDSKKRFEVSTLQTELNWMKENSLVPDGTAQTTSFKPTKIPSGF